MCYDDQARPPIPEGAKSSYTAEDIVLTASDGNQLAAFAAYPEHPTAAHVLIYPDIRGLHQFYKDLAMRFAEVGVTALAFDYFGRTAGLTSRADPFEFMPHVQKMTLPTFFRDVQAALDYMRSKSGQDAPIYVMGFCMGGGLVVQSGTNAAFGFTGLMPFYAGLSRSMGGAPTAMEAASQVKYPILAQFGGADQGIPESEVHQFDANLDATGVPHQVVIYPGAPHSFFDRRAEEFAEASANAWARVLEFMAPHRQPVAN